MNMNSLRFVSFCVCAALYLFVYLFVCLIASILFYFIFCLYKWFLVQDHCYESALRVVFGSIKHIKPPPASKTATMNVGAGQYKSSNWAMTMLPIIPPSRALIIDIATPVALQSTKKKSKKLSFCKN